METTIRSVYESYAQKRGTSTVASPVDSTTVDDPENELDVHMFGTTNAATTELDVFLKEPTIPINNDPLAWWKFSASRFPTLACIARDYIAVPGIVHSQLPCALNK